MGHPSRKLALPARDLVALAGALVFVALGFAAILLVAKVADVKDGVVLASLLIVPALIYLLLSGRITELKAPGGLEVKLSEAANRPIIGRDAVRLDALPMEDFEVVAKGGPDVLTQKLEKLDESGPIVMTMVLGRAYYNVEAARNYVNTLSQLPSFRFVVFLDQENRLAAYMEARSFRDLLDVPDIGDHVIALINQGSVDELRRLPGVLSKTVTPRMAVADVLRELEAERLRALPVVDDAHRVTGIVEREQLVSALLLALVAGTGAT